LPFVSEHDVLVAISAVSLHIRRFNIAGTTTVDLPLGEISALLTALCWSIAVFMFKEAGSRLDAVALTFWKGLLATVALVPVVVLWGNLSALNSRDLAVLVLSGVIGIAVGDAAFFAALSRLRERETLVITETSAPLLTAGLALWLIGESLSGRQALGVLIVLTGVLLVLWPDRRVPGKRIPSGVAYALLAATCQAVGAVLSRDVLVTGESGPLTASLVRLAAGTIAIAPLWWLRTPALTWPLPEVRRPLILATFFGTFLAMMLQMASFALAPAGLVQALFASSIVMTFLIGARRGQPVPARAWMGSLLATFGIFAILMT
jgi:drug/metabolite transporter (DMT)-like permease